MEEKTRRIPWWALAGMLLIPAIYLPMLAAPFDFSEDGCLVYFRAESPAELAQSAWNIAQQEFSSTGPFRPVAWAHWEAAATLWPDAFPRRVARLTYCALATGAMLWLLRELGISPAAALLTTTLAMWNFFRAEIWIGLGMPEAFGMPYALVALVCAIRAARSDRPLGWDVAGIFLLVLCLGIKNVYIAVIPALVWLRLMAGERPWRQQLLPAAIYAVLALGPLIHLALLKLDPKPNHYVTAVSVRNVRRFVRALASATALHTLLPALPLIGLALYRHRQSGWIARHRTTLGAAVALLVAGIGVYAPIADLYPRYTMPAVWGLDILFGLMFTALIAVPFSLPRRLALAAVGVVLVVVAGRCLLRQDQIAMQGRLYWQAAHHIEAVVPDGARLAVVYSPVDATFTGKDLYSGPGFHLAAHLRGRARTRAELSLLQQDTGDHPYVLTGNEFEPGPEYALDKEFTAQQWFGGEPIRLRFWRRVPLVAAQE